jgi:predicted transcriptional regulator
MKVTIAFRDDELYRSIKVIAARSGRQIRDVVEEALAEWLESRETAEDIAVSEKAIAAFERGEGIDANAFFERMVAEGRVAYRPDPDR